MVCGRLPLPVEPTDDDGRDEERFINRRGYQRDRIAASINIAKLQAMSMTDLKQHGARTRRGKFRHHAQA